MPVRRLGASLGVAAFLLIWSVGFQFAAIGQTSRPVSPGLGPYSDLDNQICGKHGTKWNSSELPWIGCFGLSAGNGVTGTIAGHQLDISVDLDGKEVCKLDGAAIGCNACMDTDVDYCNTKVDIISHNADKSVLLYIAQRVWGNTFVTNQQNWDYYMRPMRCQEPIEGAKPDPSAPHRHYRKCYLN